MKSKIISIIILSLVLSIPLILVSYAYAGSSTQSTSDLETLRLSKGKPNPKPEGEWITFEGHLVGAQIVEGCCPNAGPCPEYTMSLFGEVFPQEMTMEPHPGEIFMNFFGAGKHKRSYLVRFWWTDPAIDGSEYFIEIIGGVIEQNRKTKVLTVTFVDVNCSIWINNDPDPIIIIISFVLTRGPL